MYNSKLKGRKKNDGVILDVLTSKSQDFLLCETGVRYTSLDGCEETVRSRGMKHLAPARPQTDSHCY